MAKYNCSEINVCGFFVAPVVVRLRLPDNHRQQARNYLERATYQAAARVWSEGVPWSEAIVLAKRAIEKAHPKAKAKGHGKSKGNARPSPKGKGKGGKG